MPRRRKCTAVVIEDSKEAVRSIILSRDEETPDAGVSLGMEVVEAVEFLEDDDDGEDYDEEDMEGEEDFGGGEGQRVEDEESEEPPIAIESVVKHKESPLPPQSSIVIHDTSNLTVHEIHSIFQEEKVDTTEPHIIDGSKYRRERGMKRLMKKHVKEVALKPIKPVASCKRFQCYQYITDDPTLNCLEYDPGWVDEYLTEKKAARHKPADSTEIESIQTESTAPVKEEKIFLPNDFDSFIQSVNEKIWKYHFDGIELPTIEKEPKVWKFNTSNEYKKLLMACVNRRLHELIQSYEYSVCWYTGISRVTVGDEEDGRSEVVEWTVELSGDTCPPQGTFCFGQKALLKIGEEDSDASPDSTGSQGKEVLQWIVDVGCIQGTSVFLDFKGKNVDSLDGKECKIAPIGPLNHLLKQAEVIFFFEKQRLHYEFLHPNLKSLPSGITPHISSKFQFRYGENTPFYQNSIQKIVDTVALAQSDVSNFCVIDDHRVSNLDYLVTDTVKILIEVQNQIKGDQGRKLQEEQEIQEEFLNKSDNLHFVITSTDEALLLTTATRLSQLQCGVYLIAQDSDFPSKEEIQKEVKKIVEERITAEDPDDSEELFMTINKTLESDPKADFPNRAIFEDHARKRLFMKSQILLGKLPDLLNDPFVVDSISLNGPKENLKFFDVAVVHRAQDFKETELLTLQFFEVRKIILLGSTYLMDDPDRSTNIMHRMAHDYQKREKKNDPSVSGSKSAVLNSFVEKDREKEMKKEEERQWREKQPANRYHRDNHFNHRGRGGFPNDRFSANHERGGKGGWRGRGGPSRGRGGPSRGRGGPSRGRGGGDYFSPRGRGPPQSATSTKTSSTLPYSSFHRRSNYR